MSIPKKAVCLSRDIPVNARKFIMAIGLEDKYAQLAPDMVTFPYYSTENNIITSSFQIHSSQQAIDHFTDFGVSGGIGSITGQTFLSHIVEDELPAWFCILQAGGLLQSDILDLSQYRFTPGREKSISVYIIYDNLLHQITGARSIWGFSGVIGQPLTFSFQISGQYIPRELNIPPVRQQTIIQPETLKNAALNITLEGDEHPLDIPWTEFRISNNRTLQERYEAYAQGNISEIFLSYPIDVTWEINLELNRRIDWTEIFKTGKKAKIELQLRSNTGKMLKIFTPLYAKVKTSPGSGINNGIRTELVQFALQGNQYLEIQY